MNELNSVKNGAPRRKCIGNYTIEKTIGSGTFGKVKHGIHVPTSAQVAIKILEKHRIVDASDIERVSREIHILKIVRHPHIIQLFEIVETHKQLYLVMEYASGGELFDYIVKKKRLDEAEACRFFRQIISGVEFMHSKGIAHRDLKPENLLLDDKQNIKIVDFGLSNTFQPGQALRTACGSPCYASPEMISGKRYDPESSDVWSTGIILFAMVCGYLPFEDTNTGDLYKKIVAGDFNLPDSLSKPLRHLIRSMLATDPAYRITIAEVRLSQWYKEATGERGPSGAPLYLTCGLSTCCQCRAWTQTSSFTDLDEKVLSELSSYDLPVDYVVKCLKLNKHNYATTMYYLLLERSRSADVVLKPIESANILKSTARVPCPVYSLATPLVEPVFQDLPPRHPKLDPLPFAKSTIPALRTRNAPLPALRVPSFRQRTQLGVSSVGIPLTDRPISVSLSNSRTRSNSPSFNSSFGRPSSARIPSSRLSASPHMSSFVSSSLTRPTASTSAKMRPPPTTAPFGSTTRRLDLITPPLRPVSARKAFDDKPVFTFLSNRQFAIPPTSTRPVIQVRNGSNIISVPVSSRLPLRPLSSKRSPLKNETVSNCIKNYSQSGALRRPLAAISTKRNAYTAR